MSLSIFLDLQNHLPFRRVLPQVEHIDTEAIVIQRKHGPFLAGSRN